MTANALNGCLDSCFLRVSIRKVCFLILINYEKDLISFFNQFSEKT